MDEETSKIKHHIDNEREQLGRSLDEIEGRVRKATNIKAQFKENTALFLGAAVAGGFLLSLAVGKSNPSAAGRRYKESGTSDRAPAFGARTSTNPISAHLHRIGETIDDIFEALVAVGSDRLQSLVADAVPGFREQYGTVTRQDHRSSVHQMRSSFSETGVRSDSRDAMP